MAGRKRRVHGNVVGRLRRVVHVCNGCLTWYEKSPPAFCGQCNHGVFTRFDSTAEARRYGELLIWQRDGGIRDIRLQRKFPLHVVGPDKLPRKIGTYIIDFDYEEWRGQVDHGHWVRRYEDVKGDLDTHMSAWKRKHAEVEYGIKVDVTSPHK